MVSGTGRSDTAGIVSLFLTHFDFINQVGINSKTAPSEKSDTMLKFTPVDLKQEAYRDAGLPPPWPTGCSHMQDSMKPPSEQHLLFIRYCTQTSPMMEPLCNHSEVDPVSHICFL